MVSDDEVYGPMRNAVRDAARQLKPLEGSPYPLVVVLANPEGFFADFRIERLMEAMYGNPAGLEGSMSTKAASSIFDSNTVETGGSATTTRISARWRFFNERELAREHFNRWWEDWKKRRKPLENPSDEELIAEAEAALEAWQVSDEEANVPEGTVHLVELLTTGSPDAVPVPNHVFDGPRDRRVDVERGS